MCGIAGSWAPARADLLSMQRMLQHRGPDDRGVFEDARVQLAMTRLAIQDLSPAGHQPMCDESGEVWIVFNGEMYNFREERARLAASGAPFRSGSDTEVVLRLYLEHGDDFLARLRGMFALAIYDRRGGPGRERLLLARDHFGIKPLLYTARAGGIVFASEMKAMLASGLVDREIDRVALWQLLVRGAVYQPRTILADVRMLPPAHRLVADRRGIRIERWWSLGVGRLPELKRLAHRDLVERVEAVLSQSLTAQLVADVPVGAFLSGGVDSSLMVAFMARQHSGPVHTFSVGFPTEGAAIDESGDAAEVARALGTVHSRVEVTGAEVADGIERIAAALDQPTVDGINSYFISRFAATQLKVAISGTGGDEMFAGYPWFAAMQSFAAGRRRSLFARWRRDGFIDAFSRQYHIFDEQTARRLVGSPPPADLSDVRVLAGADELPRAQPLNRTSALVLRGYTQNQLLRDIDAASMAHSLEVRVPFIDPVVADVALSLPDEAKIAAAREDAEPGSYRGSGVKRILLDIALPLLPPGFETRAKRGFGMPFESWLRGPLRPVLRDCLGGESLSARGWLKPGASNALLRAFEAGEESWARPWLVMMIELWARNVLEAGAARPDERTPVLAATR
jgi:asparagine synthase (glutamine-hydrolysing)